MSILQKKHKHINFATKLRHIPTKCMSFLISILLIFCSMTALFSCDGADEETSGDYVEFTDALSRKVRVGQNPTRVASLLGSFSDVWMLAGGELCASAEDGWSDFDLDMPDAVNIGGAHSPSLESLLSSNPDFVLASASTASHISFMESLESMGITVAYFDVDNFQDYLQMLKICTDITDRPDLYIEHGLAVSWQIEAIKSDFRSSNIPESERKVLILRATSSFVKAKGSSGTILGEMLSDMGCINIADSDSSLLENLSVEAIIREDPHHIFVVTMGNDTDSAVALIENMMKENAAWRSLTAVKENRVHFMDKKLFNLKPNSRWSESYEILYEIFTEQQK